MESVQSVSIKPIDKESVHKICSGQVIFNLATAVKELIENALDAGATSVDIKLKEYGETSIEVSDNGTGVLEGDFEGLTAKYHTSKLKEFVDLETVPTFGFRGEALSSLCALAQMTIVTKHKSAPCGTRLEIDSEGTIVKRTPVARQSGTTVTIANLFSRLPVRKIEFRRNIKKEFGRLCTVVQAYALIAEGCRITCSNLTDKGIKTVVISTQGAAAAGKSTMHDNILCVFGNKQVKDLVEIKPVGSLSQDDDDSLNTTEINDELAKAEESGLDRLNLTRFKLTGWVSSCQHGCGRSAKDRQFFYVNARPCEPKNVTKLVNEIYHKYNVHQYPFISMNIEVDRVDVDVNLTPDKRQVLINNESILLLAIKIALIKTFEGLVGTYRIQNNISLFGQCLKSPNSSSRGRESIVPKPNGRAFSQMLSQWKQTGDTVKPARSTKVPATKRKNNNEITEITAKMRKVQQLLEKDKLHSSYKSSSEDDDSEHASEDNSTSVITCSLPKSEINFETIVKTESESLKDEDSADEVIQPTQPTRPSTVRIDCTVDSPKRIKSFEAKPIENAPPSASKLKNYKTVLKTSIAEIRAATEKENESTHTKTVEVADLDRLRFKSRIEPTANKSAEEELSREITKDNFRQMEIIGQFNLGFIVVRLDDDLFIIDQHACDEKYNFEMLQRSTVMQHQNLVIPQTLSLTVAKEMLLRDNLEVFKTNGFQFEFDDEALPMKRVKLLTKPFSQRWEFGSEDIDELLFMLQDASANTMCRPSRIRAMFASRACRKSVMIGSPLSRADMRKLVNHMGEIEHPWHCPHGRPTMRHLVNQRMLEG